MFSSSKINNKLASLKYPKIQRDHGDVLFFFLNITFCGIIISVVIKYFSPLASPEASARSPTALSQHTSLNACCINVSGWTHPLLPDILLSNTLLSLVFPHVLKMCPSHTSSLLYDLMMTCYIIFPELVFICFSIQLVIKALYKVMQTKFLLPFFA